MRQHATAWTRVLRLTSTLAQVRRHAAAQPLACARWTSRRATRCFKCDTLLTGLYSLTVYRMRLWDVPMEMTGVTLSSAWVLSRKQGNSFIWLGSCQFDTHHKCEHQRLPGAGVAHDGHL